MIRAIKRTVLCFLIILAGLVTAITADELSVSFMSSVPFTVSGTSSGEISISKIETASLTETTDSDSVLRSDVIAMVEEFAPSSNVEFKVVGKLLNYPNPFSYSTGQTEIGFRLSKAGYLTFKVYTLAGQQVYSRELTPADYGQGQYNRLPFSRSVVGEWLSPGVYVYVLVYEGRVLAKNRMVLLP